MGVNTIANGIGSTAFGNKVTTSGDGSAAFGLATSANTPATAPIVSGDQSFGLFMGNHSGTTFAAANTVGFFGGNLVIDPAVPATQFTARGVIDAGAATTAIVLPRGTTAQQPGTPTGGMIRYNTSSTPSDTVEYYDAESAAWKTLAASGGVAGSLPFSGLTAATATNSIDNTSYAQTWAWNTLAGASALTLSSTSTAAASNAQTILNIALSGANATSTQTTYGAQIANTHTGTSSTNVGLSVSASGGTNNYAAIFGAGNVGIGTTAPSSILSLGGNSAQTFGMERHTTANTAGNSLTIQAGGATSGATNKNGGDLVLSGGIATGTGDSNVLLQGYRNGSLVTLGAFYGDTYATALGNSTVFSTSTYGTAMGQSTASGLASTAMGQSTASNALSTAMGASAASGFYSTAMGLSTASGYGSTASGNKVTVSGDGSAAFGLATLANAPATDPIVSGAQSFGLFMGNHSGTTFAAANTVGFFGGNLVIDPAVPATQFTARGVIDVGAATTAIVLPRGTDAQRPGTPTGGMLRYNTTATPNDKVEYYDAESAGWIQLGSGGGALSALTAATATNSIDNTNYAQTWAWNTLAGASALTLSSTSTAAASNAQTILNIALSGANATSTQTTYGAQIANTHTGTSSTNVGLSVSASGGSNNYGLLVPSGNVGIGTTAPSSVLTVFGESFFSAGGIKIAAAGPASANFGLFTFTDATGNLNYTTSGSGTQKHLTFNQSGNVGIGTTAPSSILSLGGNAARTFGMERHTTANTGGNDLTVSAGGATSGATDKNGGNLVLSGGTATGTGSSQITFQTAAAGSTGTTDRAPATRVTIDGSGNVGVGITPTAKLDVSGQIASRRFALSDGATVAVDWNNGNIQSVTLGGNRTFTFANGVDGARYILIITQDATGSRTITWPGTVRWPGGTAAVLTTTASKTDYITFIYNGASGTYDAVGIVQNF